MVIVDKRQNAGQRLRRSVVVGVVVMIVLSMVPLGVADASTLPSGPADPDGDDTTPQADCNDDILIETSDMLQGVQVSWTQDVGGDNVLVNGSTGSQSYGETDDITQRSIRVYRQHPDLPLVRGKDTLIFGATTSDSSSDWPPARDTFQFVVVNRRKAPDPDNDERVEFKIRLTVDDGGTEYQWVTENTYEIPICDPSVAVPTKSVTLQMPIPDLARWNRRSGPYQEEFQYSTTGSQWFEVEVVDPNGDTINDPNLDNHRAGTSVDVVDSPRLDLVYQPITISDPDTSSLGRAAYDLPQAKPRQDYLQSTFPLAENNGRVEDGITGYLAGDVFEWCGNGWIFCTWGSTTEFNNQVNSAEDRIDIITTNMTRMMKREHLKNSGVDRVVAVLPPNLDTGGTPGWHLPGTATVFVKPTWGQETLSHEMMHSFGIDHNHGYDDGPDDNFGDASDVNHVEVDGYRVGDGGTKHDEYSTMSIQSATDHWIAKPNYKSLVSSFEGRSEPPEPSAAVGTQSNHETQVLSVSGILDRNESFDPDPFYLTNTTPTLQPGSNGNYTIAVENQSGVTREFSFNASFEIFVEPNGTIETDTFPVVYYLPVEGTVRNVTIRNASDAIIFARNRTASAPSVTLESPAPGATIPSNRTIEWNATDPDGDNVTTTVLVRANGSSTWELTAADTRRESVDVSGLPEGPVEVSIVASDGIRTVERTVNYTVERDLLLSNASATVNESGGEVSLTYDVSRSSELGTFYKVFPANPPEYAADPGFFSGPTRTDQRTITRTVPLSGPIDHPTNNASLQPGERYVFEAYVNDRNGGFTTTLSRFVTPSGPLAVELTGSAVNSTAVTVTANVTGFNGTDTVGSYYAYREKGTSGSNFTAGPTWDVPETENSTTITGLDPGTTYLVTIKLNNGDGDTEQKTVEVTTDS